eukprot:748338-Hanusia_phi.AAC.3
MLSTPSEPIAINGIVTDTLIRDVQDELAVDQSTIVAGFLPSISTPSSPDGGHEHIRWCLIEFNTNTRQQILTHQFINAMKFLLAKGQVEVKLNLSWFAFTASRSSLQQDSVCHSLKTEVDEGISPEPQHHVDLTTVEAHTWDIVTEI